MFGSFRTYLPENLDILLKDIKTIFLYSAGLMRKYKRRLSFAFLVKLVTFPLGLSMIYITKMTLDKGLLAKNLKVFLMLTIIGGAVYLIFKVLSQFAGMLTEKTKADFSVDVNRDLTRRLFGLDYLKIKELSSSENSFILNYDCHTIEYIMFGELPALMSLAKIPVFCVLAGLISVPLTLLVLATVPFIAVHTAWAAKKRCKYREEELVYSRKHYASLHDSLYNSKLIKSFSKEDWALDKIVAYFTGKTRISLKMTLFSFKSHTVSDLFIKLNTGIFWLLGGYLIIRGNLSFGALTAISMYTALIVSEMYTISAGIQEINEIRESISRSSGFIKDIPDETEERKSSRLSRGGDEFTGDIVFDKISFGYKNNELIFKDASFTVKPGKWTLITGVSGIGKTTLLSLLLRLFAPGDGNIYIGKNNIHHIEKTDYSCFVSSCHQEPYLFNDTIINNILLGEKAGEEFLKRIVSCSGVDEFVNTLPLGYNTLIGEAGGTLSGGQRQRIAIARALIRSPRILILDEATSFLDEKAEESILNNIKELFPGLTVIFVTHRSTALKLADEILRVENKGVTAVSDIEKTRGEYDASYSCTES